MRSIPARFWLTALVGLLACDDYFARKVMLGGEVGEVQQRHMRENGVVLQEGEHVLAFLDKGLLRSASDETVVTDRRVLHVVNGATTDLALADVEKVDTEPSAVGGTQFSLERGGMPVLQVTMVPAEHPETFGEVLIAAVAAAKAARAP